MIDSFERDSVYLVGASHQQQTRLQLLKEYNSSTSESTSEENEDGSWGDVLPESGGLDGGLGFLSSLEVRFEVFSVIPLGHS